MSIVLFARQSKCDPERAIKSGWHMNKCHWNTVVLNGSLPPKLVRELIEHSYQLVVDALPKKAREGLKAKRSVKKPSRRDARR